MENKNNTQVALPFDFKGNDIDLYVRQHYQVTFARQKKVSVLAKKVMAGVISKIDIKDKTFKNYYQFHITDFIQEGQDERSFYKEIKKAFKELADMSAFIEDYDRSKFAVRHFLNTSDVRCGYDNGTITIVLNPLLAPYFLSLAHYTNYQLKWYMTFSSWYSMRIYELLSAYKDTGYYEVDIDKFRSLMDCDGKYKTKSTGKYNDTLMILKTTEEALIELESTDCAFTVEPIKDKPKGAKGRKSIIGLKFVLKKTKLTHVPEDWRKLPEHAKLLDTLMVKYQVSEINVVRYSKAIGLTAIRDLVKSWNEKQLSKKPIANPLFYCNKVFVSMGKDSFENKEILKKQLQKEAIGN